MISSGRCWDQQWSFLTPLRWAESSTDSHQTLMKVSSVISLLYCLEDRVKDYLINVSAASRACSDISKSFVHFTELYIQLLLNFQLENNLKLNPEVFLKI